MKVNLLSRTAAQVAGCACLAATLLFTSCVSSAPLTARQNITAANQSVNFELQPIAEKMSVHMVIQKPIGKRLWITFKDIDGTTLERFCSGKLEGTVDRSYNFNDAEEGLYSFEICDGEKTITKTVKLERQDVKTIARLVIE